MAWHMTTAASGVAATSILPVEVFTKSAPANIDSNDALRIRSGVFNAPDSMMTFSTMSPSISERITSTSFAASSYSPVSIRPTLSTMSISSAPFSTAIATSRAFTSRKVWAAGNPPPTLVMRIGVPSTASPTVSTNAG